MKVLRGQEPNLESSKGFDKAVGPLLTAVPGSAICSTIHAVHCMENF